MNLAAVQQSAVAPIVGGELNPYMSWYNMAIGSRVSSFFVFRADKNGKVVKVTDSTIQVEYEDEIKEGYALGIKHGKVAGEIIPHAYVTDMSAGDEFAAGDVLAWNKYFFTRNPFMRTNVLMKSGTQATVALIEGDDTEEDGSAIASRLGRRLGTVVSKNVGISLDFDNDINDLIQVGTKVEYSTVLCRVSEALTGGLEKDDAALLSLSKHADKNPKAKVYGTISSVEVFYMGDIEEASESIQALVAADNKRRAKKNKALSSGPVGKTGELKKSAFVAGEKITKGKVVISIHIDVELNAEVGDKSSIANQLKTVHGRTWTDDDINETMDGKPLDILFGARSVNARIVYSVYIQGTMGLTLTEISKSLATAYRA